MGSSHTAIKQELLVRYLDAWLPAALHGHRRFCLVCATASTELVAAALGVLTELADLLEGRMLTAVTTLPRRCARRGGGHRRVVDKARLVAVRLADQGALSVLDLRTWAVHHTVYRAADVIHALQAMVSAGEVNRSPTSGRLAPTTMITPAHAR